MPATAPTTHADLRAKLGAIGQRIRAHRRGLQVSSLAAAEAAGMSRVTLHRIERGEPSVTMGAYLNAIAALGLELGVEDALPANAVTQTATVTTKHADKSGDAQLTTVRLANYPQLQRLAWHLPGAVEVTAQEAFGLYERNWRHIDHAAMLAPERALIDTLTRTIGQGYLLV